MGYAPLAQLVEQLTLNQWAQGSSPWRCTRPHPVCCMRTGFFVCLFGRLRPARAPSSPWPNAWTLKMPPTASRSICFIRLGKRSAHPQRVQGGPQKGGLWAGGALLVQEVCDLPLASAGSADGLFLPASLVHRAADDPNGHARPEPLTSPYPIIWTSRAHKGRVRMDSRVDATTAPAPSCSS